jgi:putative FmdB family regulatory protein
MPTYEYICSACGEHVEFFQKITDDPIKKCPACKKNKLERQFGTGAAIVFKGSGFYQTDYRSESYKKAVDKESKSGSESTASNSSETAPTSKTESKSESKSKAESPSKSSDVKSGKSKND